MSGTLRESGVVSTTDIDEVLAPGSPVAEPAHNGESTNGNGASANGNGVATNGTRVSSNGNGNGNGASANGNRDHVPGATEVLPDEPTGQDAATVQAEYVASLELRLAELVEIEKMRDLEIHHLEAELGQNADRAFELEIALFHSERRGKDLERRWQDLAEVYETAAAALVVAGGQLEAIQNQSGYRLVLRLSGMIRRYPAVYKRLHQRLHHSISS